MALPWEENYQTESAPAPKPRVVQPVVMSPPAAVAAPDPLVAAMQTMRSGAAPVAAVAPAAAPAAAPAMPALPPPPAIQPGEAPVNFKRRLSDYYQNVEKMKLEAAAPAKKRDLPSSEVEKITAIDNSLGTQMRLMETFDPNYAGYKVKFAGDVANTMASTFGGDKEDQADWWKSYNANDNIARNALYGASLTPGEQKSWEATTVDISMTPSMIERRMKERAALIEAKRKTTVENFGKANYNVENFQAAPTNFSPSAVIAPPINMLKEGHITTFDNGQQWLLKNGKPQKVK